MKNPLLLILLALAGCQTAAPVPLLPQSAKIVPEPKPVVTAPAEPAPSTSAFELKLRQQAQYIEALLNQNDALAARLAAPVVQSPEVVAPAFPAPAAKLATVTPVVAAPPVPGPGPTQPEPESALVPNADGVIDLAAMSVAAKPGEAVNPFAVRAVPADSMREISVQVSGIVAGPTPCAVLNGRLVQPGETIESLAVERIESDAVLVRQSGHLLRLPVSEKPIRLRLPL